MSRTPGCSGVDKLPVEEHQKNHGTAKKRVHHGGGTMPVESPSMPQDVKTSPDGKLFYVADMMADGVHVIDPVKFTRVAFIPTGLGAHGLYPSRDSKVPVRLQPRCRNRIGRRLRYE